MAFYGMYLNLLPWWGFAILFTATRTSLAGVGHYHCHRTKDGFVDWANTFFDI